MMEEAEVQGAVRPKKMQAQQHASADDRKQRSDSGGKASGNKKSNFKPKESNIRPNLANANAKLRAQLAESKREQYKLQCREYMAKRRAGEFKFHLKQLHGKYSFSVLESERTILELKEQLEQARNENLISQTENEELKKNNNLFVEMLEKEQAENKNMAARMEKTEELKVELEEAMQRKQKEWTQKSACLNTKMEELELKLQELLKKRG
ncbi:uncharacterized protein LOC128756361 [Synchiropus splendidus]|uniref:uncharacterized protein LOC128756361 n=1 Tax=Synchiropus splendidus TaxID=270530 RepID=UPI00237E429B|nr:uncharacterized protein LOC128756361 [Synchiropus splendidus]